MGMSLQDFDRCTPLEFEKIFEMWHEARQLSVRTSWEQIRQLALCMLQPWSKEELRAEDVMVFSWERAAATPQHSGQAAMTPEERRRHYEEVKKARGLI